MATEFRERARRMRNAVEPVAAGVYFAPEAHAAYEALGFEGSSLVSKDGIERPELKSYFISRGACMGQVAGEVVAAAFGVFNPKFVVPGVAAGWQITSRAAILQAREQAATAMLAGSWVSNPRAWVGSPTCCAGAPTPRRGQAARSMGGCARSASPTTRWVPCGGPRTCCASTAATATSSPGRSAAPTRWRSCSLPNSGGGPGPLLHPKSWLERRRHGRRFDRLTRRGLMSDDEQLTDAGRAFRDEVEVRTGELERPVLEALGEDLEELLEHLDAWSEGIIAAGSYPKRIAGVYNVGGGPHFGSGLTIDTAAEQYGNKP
jgi:hypothetical protein